jgi:hypothetical protein
MRTIRRETEHPQGAAIVTGMRRWSAVDQPYQESNPSRVLNACSLDVDYLGVL